MSRIAVCAVLVAVTPSTAAAQARPPVVQSVDVQVLAPPITVRVDGATIIAWELHLTNLMGADVAITRIRVSSDGAPLADLSGDALRAIIGRPGVPRVPAVVNVMSPGGRSVAYFWIPLSGTAPPRSIRHTIDIEVRRASGTVTTTFDTPAWSVTGDLATVIDAPLRGGTWVAAWDPLLIGGHRTAFYTFGGRARLPGRFAIDFVRLTRDSTLDQTTPRPADWNGAGTEVLAVADGIVAAAMDDIPDNDPERRTTHTLENASGNHVVLEIGQRRFAFYEHLQHGSVAVRPGERVSRGQVIGRLGNSGSSSIGPHLHFHVADSSAELSAEGVPFVFRRFEYLGAFTSIDSLHAGSRWNAAPMGRAGVRTLERPGPNAVIDFR